MATRVYRNAYFWLNGVDYSADLHELGLTYAAEMLDETAFGDDTRIKKGGLKTWTVTAKAHQDFATSHVGANLFPLVGTTTCFELRPDNSCTTASNPSYYGVGILVDAPPVVGGVGTLLQMAFSLQAGGSLSRASSS